jgi:glutamate 5-kinase
MLLTDEYAAARSPAAGRWQVKPLLPRRDWIDQTRRVVVKIGTRVLVDGGHRLRERRLGALVAGMAAVCASGRQVVCVSSGAVAAGLRGLALARRPRDLPSLQAAAAVGQARLIEMYRTCFGGRGITAAQVLLTHDDLGSRERHLNARNTFARLLDAGVVAVVNENDTVAVEEIRVGDNDMLSALVACLVRADLLVMLTDSEGLLARPQPPGRGSRAAGAAVIAAVPRITPEILAMAGPSASPLSIGGMRSKVLAADVVTRAGEHAIIANGRAPRVLERLFAGEPLGTVFLPRPRRMRGRKRWIAFFDRPRGGLRVDGGAARALRCDGSSLLAVGITGVEGSFARGAAVRIVGPDGSEIGRGLVNYSAADLARIAGLPSARIAATLGGCEYLEVIHRDNMVLEESDGPGP